MCWFYNHLHIEQCYIVINACLSLDHFTPRLKDILCVHSALLMWKSPGLCVSPQGWSEMSGWELWAEIHVMLAHMHCDAADTHSCVGLRIASRWMGGCAAELKMKDTWDPPPPPHHISVRSLMWTGLRLRKRGRASLNHTR